MSITVVGSVAFDAVKTPFGVRDRMLGGAATYFALAASFFDQVHVVGRVGEDFGDEDLAVVALRGTDVGDIERVPGGKSFFWAGEYGWDLNSRQTLDTQLGVFEDFQPRPATGPCARGAATVRSGASPLPQPGSESHDACPFVSRPAVE